MWNVFQHFRQYVVIGQIGSLLRNWLQPPLQIWTFTISPHHMSRKFSQATVAFVPFRNSHWMQCCKLITLRFVTNLRRVLKSRRYFPVESRSRCYIKNYCSENIVKSKAWGRCRTTMSARLSLGNRTHLTGLLVPYKVDKFSADFSQVQWWT